MRPALLALAAACAGIGAWMAAHLFMQVIAEKRVVSKRLSLDDVLEDQTLSFVLFSAAGAAVSSVLALWSFPACLGAAFVLSRKLPVWLERKRARQLRSSCDGQLDVFADMLAMGVRAGLSFDAALDLCCSRFSGELSTQLRAARLKWASGIVSRRRALDDLACELDSRAMRRFSETVVQAIRYGSPLADLLSTFADDLRRQRHAAVEKQVAKAPVKMFLPLGTCILPAMVILVMGPVFLQFLDAGV